MFPGGPVTGRGCSTIFPNTVPRSSGWVVNTIREPGARIMQNGRIKDIPRHGFIIREEINITYEYWIDYSLDGKHVLAGMKMPVRYVVVDVSGQDRRKQGLQRR